MTKGKKVVKGNKYIIMNLANGSVHMVIAKGYLDAFDRARKWFGDSRVKAWRDTLSSQLN